MDRTKDACRYQSNNRVIMWYKIRELYSKGFNKSQIAFQLGLHRSTVRRYLKMDEDTLTAKLQHRRRYPRILDKYESYVCDVLSRRSILCQLIINSLRLKRQTAQKFTCFSPKIEDLTFLTLVCLQTKGKREKWLSFAPKHPVRKDKAYR